ncbi:hypothetical protein KUCAC02_007014 [Chaenocephalus aceratus]|nr:hypothetical protein KUCAC02_007014 [Chaenocephalus aceratus]
MDSFTESKVSSDSGDCFVLMRDDNMVRLIKSSGIRVYEPDIVFPMIHGTSGEDGTLQGFLRQVNIPFVGCDVCASACTMDKDITKRLLSFDGIRVAKGRVVTDFELGFLSYEELKQELGEKLFVKPACSGSSVGASLVYNAKEYEEALRKALRFSSKVLVEEYLLGREIEFAVMGNREVFVSDPGEIVIDNGFYDYDKKYKSCDVRCKVPAKIESQVTESGQGIAKNVYRILGCEGLARVDFFLINGKDWVVNEINTIPGFTQQSLYPQLWAIAGKSMEDLINELLELAVMSYNKREQLSLRAFG